MRTKLLLVTAFAVMLSAPAFAAVQNVRVSGDIDSTYINRNHFSLGAKAPAHVDLGLAKQSVFITQTRLRVDADLSDNVATTVGLINERAWNAENNANTSTATSTGNTGDQDTNVQLYLAYATMREFLNSPLTVSVGRQVFHYGNGLIMGDGGQNNLATGNLVTVAADLTKRTTYDGVKAILDYKPLTLDLIYFKNNQGILNGNVNSDLSSSDVFGINANYQLGDDLNTVVEGYLFARVNGGNNTSTVENKGDTLYVPGLRVSTNPVKGLNAGAEVAWQGGNKAVTGGSADGDGIQRQAMAYQLMMNYALSGADIEKYKPSVNASVTHVSGDKNAGNARQLSPPSSREHYTAWDPFNEAQGAGTIYNSIFDLTNMNIVSAGMTVTPLEDVTTSFTWSGLWAARELSSANTLTFRQPDGSSVTPTTTTNKQMGHEYDVNVNYAYTEDVSFGVNLGWFVPGKTFTSGNDSTASQALAHVLVNF